jgi:uncharacterized protein (TIGR03000 family)
MAHDLGPKGESAMHSYLLAAVLGVAALCVGAGQLSAAAPEGAPANINVSLPADATLTIDGSPTKSTSANRWFVTPPLPEGKSFTYTLKADFVREGKTITVQQKVSVRAGGVSVVSLDVPGQAVAGSGVGSSGVRNFYYAPEAPTYAPAAPTTTGSGYNNYQRHGERR